VDCLKRLIEESCIGELDIKNKAYPTAILELYSIAAAAVIKSRKPKKVACVCATI